MQNKLLLVSLHVYILSQVYIYIYKLIYNTIHMLGQYNILLSYYAIIIIYLLRRLIRGHTKIKGDGSSAKKPN
ncbi:hypothetical protein EDC94DRAFT_88072 [Helicostylum pulchrum]|nr:hypothetical protein EDC94DRAFT_88072 [Helicostylum pulchrum]